MGVKLGPAGVPLSCKGRTIVEGMDDIIALGLETMEAQTVRLIQPQHFEQYWQAGVLGLRRLIVNASLWCMGLETSIMPNLNVKIVGDYQPRKSGFNYEKLGVIPQLPSHFR